MQCGTLEVDVKVSGRLTSNKGHANFNLEYFYNLIFSGRVLM